MSALSIDYAPQIPLRQIEREHLADVIPFPLRELPAVQPHDGTRPGVRAHTVRQPIRLTARGIRMVRAVATLLALAASIGIGAGLGVALRPAAGEVSTVVVESGQSLWSIAATAAAPGQDVRDVVAEIVSLNGLTDSGIAAGQELSVPIR
ncbi:MAG: LysM peptidoglycan-binding domain-containing protein [Ruaniaceae bacterium]|nr:LysM peptidoglycan-binding domain-containing protein [Ruaniaceae bacterium]